MPGQLMRPEVLLLIVFVLWGIAGKLDEPLEGFDPEPATAQATDIADEPVVHSLHLLCFPDEAGEDSVRQAPMPVLAALPASRHVSVGRPAAPGRRLICVVTDEQETPVNHLNLPIRALPIRALPMQHLLPVRSVDELEHLVKESEVLTGTPGRTFVVAVADRPAYQVHADVAGFQIARLDGAVPHEVLATAPELASHPIGSAMACGLLYTEPLPQ